MGTKTKKKPQSMRHLRAELRAEVTKNNVQAERIEALERSRREREEANKATFEKVDNDRRQWREIAENRLAQIEDMGLDKGARAALAESQNAVKDLHGIVHRMDANQKRLDALLHSACDVIQWARKGGL